MEASVLHGLKQGNDVLKEIHKEMNTESVEKLLDETAEARAYQQVRYNKNTIYVLWIPIYEQEINDMLANNLTLDDEEAVQEELRQLQALVTLLSVFYLYNVAHSSPLFLSCLQAEPEREAPKLPSVPATEPVSSAPGMLSCHHDCLPWVLMRRCRQGAGCSRTTSSCSSLIMIITLSTYHLVLFTIPQCSSLTH